MFQIDLLVGEHDSHSLMYPGENKLRHGKK